MKVRLIPLGCKIPNLALMKLSAFHKARGDEVSLDEPEPDLVYVSSILRMLRTGLRNAENDNHIMTNNDI